MPRQPEQIDIFAPGTRSRKRPNRSFVARGWVDGKRIDKAIPGATDEEQARSIAAEYFGAARARAAEQSRPAARPETFRQLICRYREARRLPQSECRYLDRLVAAKLDSLGGDALGDVLIGDLCPALAQEAASRLYGKRTAKTMNRAAISPFAAAIHFAAENQWMPYLKVKGFKVIDRKTPRLPGSEADVRRLLVAAATSKPKKCDRYKAEHPYRYVLLVCLFRQGWRITETLRLNWSQVDLVHGVFRDFAVDKGRAIKPIDMHDQVFEALAALPVGEPERALSERRGRVFPWVNRYNVRRWLRPFCAEVGIRFTPHMARVEFASQLSEAGTPDAGIRDVGSWADTRSISRYTRTNEQTRRAILARLGQAPAAAEDQGEPASAPGGKRRSL